MIPSLAAIASPSADPATTQGFGKLMIQLAIGIRAGQWWYFLALPVASVPSLLWRGHPGRALLLWLAGATISGLCLAYAYAINGLSERSTDLDARKNPWVGRETQAGARLAVAALAAFAVGLAVLAGPLALWAASLSVVSATVYSTGPRTKRHVALGTLSNALIFGPLLLVAPGASWQLPLAGWLGTFVALLLQNQLIHEQVDAQEDCAAGDHSTAAWLGTEATHKVLIMLGIVAAAAATWAASRPWALGFLLATVAGATAVASSGQPAQWRRQGQRWLSFGGAALAYLLQLVAS